MQVLFPSFIPSSMWYRLPGFLIVTLCLPSPAHALPCCEALHSPIRSAAALDRESLSSGRDAGHRALLHAAVKSSSPRRRRQ